MNREVLISIINKGLDILSPWCQPSLRITGIIPF